MDLRQGSLLEVEDAQGLLPLAVGVSARKNMSASGSLGATVSVKSSSPATIG